MSDEPADNSNEWKISPQFEHHFSSAASDTLNDGVTPKSTMAVYEDGNGSTLRYNYNDLAPLARVDGGENKHLPSIGLRDNSVDVGLAYLIGKGAADNDDVFTDNPNPTLNNLLNPPEN